MMKECPVKRKKNSIQHQQLEKMEGMIRGKTREAGIFTITYFKKEG